MIEAELPDGRILEFPDGTPTATIQATVKRMLAGQAAPAAPAAAPAPSGQGMAAPAPQMAPEAQGMAPAAPELAQQAAAQPISGVPADLVGLAPQAQEAVMRERAALAQQAQQQAGQGNIVRKIGEPAATIASSIVAEPIAGLTGLATMPFAGSEKAQQNIEAVREALTYQPRTEEGMRGLQAVGEAVQPIGEAIQKVEKGVGDLAYKATGSEALAAVATTLPAAALEAIGLGKGRQIARTATGLKRIPNKITLPSKVSEAKITKQLVESAPEINQIKDASRAIYKEIDNMNVALKPLALKSMVGKVVRRARAENVDDVLTPKSARVVEQFLSEVEDASPRTLSDLDQLRKKAQIAAQATDPSDARVGAMMVDEIDEFIDSLPPAAFTGPDAATAAKVSERFKAARGLWGRARRAEVISEIFDKAQRQATGFENGIRTQLRQLLNNKKRSRYFSKNELQAMDDLVKGTNSANVLKLIGRLGFSEGAATNVLGGLVGMGVLGPAAPVAGQISRKLAQKMTQGAFNRMEALVRSGADGRKIAQAYLQSVPKGQRNAMELSDMLLSAGTDVDELVSHSRQVVKEAAEIARARKIFTRAEAAGAAAPAAAMTAAQQEQR